MWYLKDLGEYSKRLNCIKVVLKRDIENNKGKQNHSEMLDFQQYSKKWLKYMRYIVESVKKGNYEHNLTN